VLCVLRSFVRLLRTDAPLSPNMALVWVAVLAAGSTSFGTGLGIAAALPLVAALALPGRQLPRRSALVLGLGAVLTVAGYQLVLVRSSMTTEAREVVSLLSNPGLLPGALQLTAYLVAFGAAALLFDMLGAHQRLPFWTQAAGAGGLMLLVLAACASADAVGRRRLVALALLASSAYGAIAAGRSAVYAALPVSLAFAAQVLRYHYLPLALLTVLLCAALAELAGHGKTASRAVAGVIGLWMLGRVVVLVLFPLPIDIGDQQRAAVENVMWAIRNQAARTPAGQAVLVENHPFGQSFAMPALMPGWAAVFVVFSPEDTVEGRPVRFLVADEEWQRAQARGGRIAELLVRR